MQLNLSNEDAAFRDEVRSLIAEYYPAEMRAPNPETDLTKGQSLLWHRHENVKKALVAASELDTRLVCGRSEIANAC